ncbi:MAG: YdcF family protein [Betaproteobacteria bacterium]|nr:MAG: YdcF family protein [Betaproteobacteria bacterium]
MEMSLLDPIWVKAVFKALLLPPTGLILVALLGLSLYRRFPRTGRAMAWGSVLLLFVLSMPAVSGALLRGLETAPAFDIAHAADARAIVIIGGGKRRHAAEYGGDTLGTLTLERVRYGVDGGETEAKLMQEALEREFGQQVQWLEARSRTTHENALRSAEILRAAGIRRVILVAHYFDMRRATAEFTDAQIDTIPAPTGGSFEHPDSVLDFLPSMSGLRGSYYALYEISANIVRAIWH